MSERVGIELNVASPPAIGVGAGTVQTVVESDYEELTNHPRIEGNELVGDKTFDQLGLDELSNIEIAEIFRRVMEV